MHHLSSVAFMRLKEPVGFRSMVIPEVPPKLNSTTTIWPTMEQFWKNSMRRRSTIGIGLCPIALPT